LKDYFKTTEQQSRAKKRKIIITPRSSELVPKYVSYILYPDIEDTSSEKYLRARCAQRQRKVISEDEKASIVNCPAQLYIFK